MLSNSLVLKLHTAETDKGFLSTAEHQEFDRTERTTAWESHQGLGDPRDTLGRPKPATGSKGPQRMNGIFPELCQLFPHPRSAVWSYTSAWSNSEVTLQSVKAPECKQSFLKQEASINTMNQTRSKSLLRKKEKERKKLERQVKKVMRNSHAGNTWKYQTHKSNFMYV